MADPATMMLVGAGLGAASNKDDPFKGAMMGAALGGLGGAGYGAMAGSGAAAGAAGTAGAAELGALARPDVAPVLSDWITQAQASGQVPLTPAYMPEFFPTVPSEVGMRGDLSWMDTISPSQQAAIGTGALPGATGMNPMSAMAAQSLLKPPEQPQMGGGGVRRGDPRALSDAVISLLAPKQVAKRKISLL